MFKNFKKKRQIKKEKRKNSEREKERVEKGIYDGGKISGLAFQ